MRAALEVTGERFAALVESARDPGARATRHWSVADTAAHVAAIAFQYTGLARGGERALPMGGLAEQVAATTVDTVAVLNELTLRQFTERDPGALARGLRTDIREILRVSAELDPALPVPWLGGSRVPLAGILAHLLNELLIHGRDIARRLRARWAIPPAHAGLFIDLFLVGVLRYGVGRLLDNDQAPRERRIAVELRSAYTVAVTLVLHRGRVTVEQPGGATDVRLSFDPATLNLLMFHRIGGARALLSGKVRVRGRVWLLPTFLRTVRLP